MAQAAALEEELARARSELEASQQLGLWAEAAAGGVATSAAGWAAAQLHARQRQAAMAEAQVAE
eukprot:COSAG01_NODE_69966_length_260_cov_0.490683_1_plen_63_part_10